LLYVFYTIYILVNIKEIKGLEDSLVEEDNDDDDNNNNNGDDLD
jgi:hypothetical protein